MGSFATYEPHPRRRHPAAGGLLRPAAAADLPVLTALRAARSGEAPAEARTAFERLLDRSHQGTARVLLVHASGRVRAYGNVVRFEPPPEARAGCAPAGWYLAGLVVAPGWRRRGLGDLLTRARLGWVAAHASEAWYFANAANRPTIDLHERHGFREVTRAFWYPGVRFGGAGVGILFRARLLPCTPPQDAAPGRAGGGTPART